MGKLLPLFILLFIISGCSATLNGPTSRWDRIGYQEVPGIVAVTTGWGRSPMCTGNIIADRVVLTAGHCLGIPAEDLYITYGCDDIGQKHCKKSLVKDTAFHPDYRKDFVSSHDIGVLITEDPLEGIEIVKLYEGDLKEKTTALAAGFGRRFGGSGVLYNALVRIVRDYHYEIIAGKSGSSDPNPGDSGGPLFKLVDGELLITGILSRSIMNSKNRSGFGIYTKIQSYGWVRNIIDATDKFNCTPEEMVLSYKHGGITCP